MCASRGGEGDADEVGQSALEAAERFSSGLAFSAFAFEVGGAVGAVADLVQRNGVKRLVELAVAPAVVAASRRGAG
jgi:hypothetical protein